MSKEINLKILLRENYQNRSVKKKSQNWKINKIYPLHISILFSILCVSFFAKEANAQNKGPFYSRIYFPSGIGVAVSPSNTLKAGFVLTTGLEFRIKQEKKHNGLFFSLNYNNRSYSYENMQLQETNIEDGEVHFNDFLIGAGYRFRTTKKFQFTTLWQFCVSSCNYGNVIANENGSYSIQKLRNVVPATKLMIGAEYYIFDCFGLYANIGYIWYFSNTPFSGKTLGGGALEFTVGFTCPLF